MMDHTLVVIVLVAGVIIGAIVGVIAGFMLAIDRNTDE
jgi:hypothetical protein